MGHYRCIQVSASPLSKEEIENFSVDVDNLSEVGADYTGYCNEDDALEELKHIFKDCIVRSTKSSITISKKKLGAMLKKRFKALKSDVAKMKFPDDTDSYKLNVSRNLSTGDMLLDEDWSGYPEQTWDFMVSMYKFRFKESPRFKLYYGASIDFHV